MNALRWAKTRENDLRFGLPINQELYRTRIAYSDAYGRRRAQQMVNAANAQQEENVRRLRDVGVAFEKLSDRIKSDPSLSAKDASEMYRALIQERQRLVNDQSRIAVNVENGRAIAADPIAWAEAHFEKFPALAQGVPGLPPF